ncbi:YfbK domain-containing protein [Sporomusa malonica]|uniref:Ca-activated chloride channel family protein n=1 Tax=Sporomusa malonica TaxID=112901 RepID=A0A1W2EHL8_9FIRM|nr:von Willebrand factor type A domain-containing protein [Sporomusa malonica]SMD09209.1 Ca-activated chloride channel family protein [Sporomusa malonica]
MKRLFIILFLVCFITTTWAAPLSFVDKVKQAAIAMEINANGMPVEDLLALLSEQSGIRILAVPEVAGRKIDLKVTARETLEQVLSALSKNYQLTYRLNEKRNAIIVFPAPYHDESYKLPSSSVMSRANLFDEWQLRVSMAPGVVGPYQHGGSFDTEEYKRSYDNQYQEVASSPVSVLATDVDTAAYSNVRRFLNSGKLPPPDAVRTEEMLNYFAHDYPQPDGEHPISVTTEVSACPWQPGHQLVLIGLQGKNFGAEELPPSNLVFLIDVSGSMAEPNKLPLLQTSFKMLVKQLREEDTVSIVVYAGQAGVVLEPTSGRERTKIDKAIDSLKAGGSTAGGEGIQLAYQIARENFRRDGNNRVILATDGDFNVGVSSEGELTQLIEERRNDGIFLSVIGVGTGNIKDNKMEALADKGNGMYAYLDNAQEAAKVMVGQLASTLYTIAKDVKVQVEFNPLQVKYYRLIGYENRIQDKRDFRDDKKDAGDMGAGHSVTVLYEVIPANSQEVVGTVEPLLYQRSEPVPSEDLLQVKVRYKKPAESASILIAKHVGTDETVEGSSARFRFAAAVAEYALLLRNSEFKGQSSYPQVLEMASGAKGRDNEGYRGEFIRLVEISQLLDER